MRNTASAHIAVTTTLYADALRPTASTYTDLIIDGMSFRRLPDRLDPSARSKNGGATSATSSSSNSRKPNTSNSKYAYSTGNYAGSNGGSGSRNSSFGPWECPCCTLVNEKPLAPICEACGGPKPDHICESCAFSEHVSAHSPYSPSDYLLDVGLNTSSRGAYPRQDGGRKPLAGSGRLHSAPNVQVDGCDSVFVVWRVLLKQFQRDDCRRRHHGF